MSRKKKNKGNQNNNSSNEAPKMPEYVADREVNSPVRQIKSISGLMACVLKHNTSSSNAEFTWFGEPLNDVWPQVLAFLKWTYDTYHSESQMRLFVNKNTGQWAAWAFPQKARTGMTAHELDDKDEEYKLTIEQRAQFSDADGWYYFGTVHHHCSAGAFQSGPDTANERDQDGVHITVGNMDKNQYSIHFRFYLGGFNIKIPILAFWDTNDEMDTVPDKFRSLLPANTEELLARHQMGVPAPKDTEFPEVWKQNIIDVTPKAVTVSHPVNVGHYHGHFGKTYTEKSAPNLSYDLERARKALMALIESNKKNPASVVIELDMALKCLEELDEKLDYEIMDLFGICVQNDVLPGKLVEHIERCEAWDELRREKEAMENEGRVTKSVGHEPPPLPVTVHTAGQPQQQQTRKPYVVPPHWSDLP